jgi:hypothetical protein
MLEYNNLNEIFRLCCKHDEPDVPFELVQQTITLNLLRSMPEATQDYIKYFCINGNSECELMKLSGCHEDDHLCSEIKKCTLNESFSHIPVLCDYNNMGYNGEGYDFISLIKAYLREVHEIDSSASSPKSTASSANTDNSDSTKVNFSKILPDERTCRLMSIARTKKNATLKNQVHHLKQDLNELQQRFNTLLVSFNQLQTKEQPLTENQDNEFTARNLKNGL